MKKILASAVVFLFSGLLIASVNAGSTGPAATPTGEGQAQTTGQEGQKGRIITNKSGTSVAERYKKRVAAKKKAMEMRQRLIKESQDQKVQ